MWTYSGIHVDTIIQMLTNAYYNIALPTGRFTGNSLIVVSTVNDAMYMCVDCTCACTLLLSAFTYSSTLPHIDSLLLSLFPSLHPSSFYFPLLPFTAIAGMACCVRRSSPPGTWSMQSLRSSGRWSEALSMTRPCTLKVQLHVCSFPMYPVNHFNTCCGLEIPDTSTELAGIDHILFSDLRSIFCLIHVSAWITNQIT